MIKNIYLAVTMCLTILAYTQINSNSPKRGFNSNKKYNFGIIPTNLPSGGTYGQSQDAADAYNSWKSSFAQTCSNGIRILYDDNSSTVSEGIGYGMLLAAYAGDKPLFDGLWQYYKANSNTKGVMNWKLSGCTGTTGSNGATDAELDVAMALIIAEEQWPAATSPYEYSSEALTLIGKIRKYEIHPSTYQTLNGDAWGTSNSCRNPSYFAPAYYREFAKIESSQSTFWDKTVAASNSYLLLNRNGNTGLVSNWADNTATPNNCNGNNEFGWDACRNPWRMGIDMIWNGAATATTASDICTKLAAWSNGNGSNLKGPLSQTASNPSAGTYKNSAFVGPWAVSVMGSSSTYQSHLNTCYSSLKGINGEAYFGATLRVISLFVLTGNFWKPTVTNSVGITDEEFSKIEMYPNPFVGSFTISNAQNIESITISDVLGRVVETVNNTSNQIELGNNYPKGMYFVRLNYLGDKKTYKLIKE